MFLDWQTRWPLRGTLAAATLVAFVGLSGCDDAQETPAADPQPEPAAEPEPEAPQGLIPSHKARVKFKGGERYARDLAAALELPREGLCSELGLYDCVGEVHAIALGGVEPYEKGIDEPLPVAPVSAAIAIDRVALSACTARAEQDFAQPADAVIFGPLLGADGPQRADLEAVAADLIDRVLRRDATADEVAAIADFYAEAQADSETPAKAYGQLSCFAVATMLEALYY